MMKKILICDDSPVDRASLEKIVTESGNQAVVVNNGKEAVERAKAEKPALIFLDIVMPDVDGYAACRALASDPETKGIPVVFVTSKGQKADRLWAQMQGGKDLVAKPYERAQILEQLKLRA